MTVTRRASRMRAASVRNCSSTAAIIAYNLRCMPPFDAHLLLQEYGDEGLVRDLARLVIDTTPEQIDAVQKAVAANDAATLRAAATSCAARSSRSVWPARSKSHAGSS